MFCSRCGKRVLESMLFCPFCGSEIIIPDQDGEAEVKPKPAKHMADPEREAALVGSAPERFSFESAGEDAPAVDVEPAAGIGSADEPSPRERTTGPSAGDATEGAPEAAFAWMEPPFDRQPEPAAPLPDWQETSDEPANGAPPSDEPASGEPASGRTTVTEAGAEEPPQADFFLEGDEEAPPADEAPKPKTKSAEPARAARDAAPPSRRRDEPSRVPVLQRRKAGPKREPDDADAQRGAKPKVYRNPVAAQANRGRKPDTLAPARPVSSEEMFMDDISDDYEDFDDFDAFEDAPKRKQRPSRVRARQAIYDEDDEEDDDDFEDLDDPDDDKGGFFMRHIRGLVGIILFLVLIMLIILYALSDSGQTSLGRINATLPLRAEIYGRLGYESYQAADYRQAGVYYERALTRDPASYNYASSAAMSYIAQKDTDKAVEMLKKCIEIEPGRIEPYIYLLNTYPDTGTRPWEITQLIQQGYQRTGDQRLNVNG